MRILRKYLPFFALVFVLFLFFSCESTQTDIATEDSDAGLFIIPRIQPEPVEIAPEPEVEEETFVPEEEVTEEAPFEPDRLPHEHAAACRYLHARRCVVFGKAGIDSCRCLCAGLR